MFALFSILHKWTLFIKYFFTTHAPYEGVSVTIGNPAFFIALYLTGVHFRGELQHICDVSEQKIKCRPIRTREIGGVRLSEELHIKNSFQLMLFLFLRHVIQKTKEHILHK